MRKPDGRVILTIPHQGPRPRYSELGLEPLRYPVYILTYKRPDKQLTLHTLLKGGVPREDIYLVVSDDDPTLARYRDLYGDRVVVFRREDYAWVDPQINDGRLAGVVYARNAVYDIAERMGHDFFVVLDDDYTYFDTRISPYGDYGEALIRNVKALLDILMRFYMRSSLDILAIAQTGDYIGGGGSTLVRTWGIKRKAMNAYWLSTKRRVRFVGRFNEDLTTSVIAGKHGQAIVTVFVVSLYQLRTQTNPGGLTELYLEAGTYVKSFQSVMAAPDCVRVSVLRSKYPRIHHRVDWDKAVPKIVPL